MKVVIDALGAGLAIAAAMFWFLSASGRVPTITSYWDRTPADDPFYISLQRSAHMNRWAAAFSGGSALCVAASLLLSGH